MADDGWTSERILGDEPTGSQSVLAHSFYQVLRRLECAHPELPRLGDALDPALEPVRLGQSPSLAFSSASFVAEEPSDREKPARLTVSFFGLFGPNGPMPSHLSDYVYQRLHSHRDPTLVRFGDVFHHRLLTLFYRAWANAQPTVSADRPASDHFARYVGALIGRYRAAGPLQRNDLGALRNARHFVTRTRHPEGLRKVLTTRFGVRVDIQEFVAEWLKIPDEYCWRLSAQVNAVQSQLGQLGAGTRIGTEVLERQFKFRIVLGPVAQTTYDRFLPGGDLMQQLTDMVRLYIGHELSWDVSLLLDATHVKSVPLGSGRIGRTTYLGVPAKVGAQPPAPRVLDPLAQAS